MKHLVNRLVSLSRKKVKSQLPGLIRRN